MPGMPGVPGLGMQNALVPAGQQAEPEVADEQFPTNLTEEGEESGEAMPAPEAEEEQQQEPTGPTQAERLVEAATDAGLSLPTQRKARKALRGLIRRLSTSKEEDWQGHIATAISQEFSIYHYIKAVTVKAAAMEAGADEPLTERIIRAMQSSGMVPDDVPYE